MEERCHECGRTFIEANLRKCPVCFKYFCEEHSYRRSGRSFCSRGCAMYFFTSEGED